MWKSLRIKEIWYLTIWGENGIVQVNWLSFVLSDPAYNSTNNNKIIEVLKLKVHFYGVNIFLYDDKIINVNFSIELLSAFFFNG